MGQDLTYQSGDQTYEYRISRADWELMQALRTQLPNEVDALFTVPGLGEPMTIPATTLREAVDAIAAFVAGNRDLLPYTYQFKVEQPGDPHITPGFSTGGTSGIQLPGDTEHYYSIWAGLNKCELRKSAVGPDGRGYEVGKQDLRGERKLVTANMGTITIQRARAKTDLVKALPAIQLFLQNVSGAEVIKRVD